MTSIVQRGVWLAIVGLVAACESPASYGILVTYRVHDAKELDFLVDGDSVTTWGSGDNVSFDVTRRYGSYAAAHDAEPVVLHAFRGGALRWTHDLSPALCDEWVDQCGTVIEAHYAICLSGDGVPDASCGSLACLDEKGRVCGGGIP